MAKTNTEKIEELSTLVSGQLPLLKHQMEEARRENSELKQSVQRLTDQVNDLNRRLTTVEQRCTTLEKHSDRTWQVWLALLVAGIGLLVSLLKK
jgi:predicted nuclease with TOPRIM domain